MSREKILSIRLSPGGLSFWIAGISAEKEIVFEPAKDRKDNLHEAIRSVKETVGDGWHMTEVYPDTLRTVMVPAEYASADAVAQLLGVNNITVGEAEEVIYAEVSPIIKAAVLYDRGDMDILREALNNVAIASPFRLNSDCVNKYGAERKRSASIYLTPAHAYITVFEKKSGAWLYADVMKWSAATDILYYMSVLDQQLELRKGKVYLRGTQACEVGALLRKYFKKTRCE